MLTFFFGRMNLRFLPLCRLVIAGFILLSFCDNLWSIYSAKVLFNGHWNNAQWEETFTAKFLSLGLLAWPILLSLLGFYVHGKYVRWSGIVLMFITSSMVGQGAGLVRACLFYSILIDQGNTWAIRLAQLHVVIFYLICGLNKAYSDIAWRNGDALYYILQNPVFTAWPWPKMLFHAWFVKPMTWAAIVSEILLPVLVFIPRLTFLCVGSLVLFHLVMALCMPTIATFTLSMIPGVTLFLIKQEES